jgi:hypothetical protein
MYGRRPGKREGGSDAQTIGCAKRPSPSQCGQSKLWIRASGANVHPTWQRRRFDATALASRLLHATVSPHTCQHLRHRVCQRQNGILVSSASHHECRQITAASWFVSHDWSDSRLRGRQAQLRRDDGLPALLSHDLLTKQFRVSTCIVATRSDRFDAHDTKGQFGAIWAAKRHVFSGPKHPYLQVP